MFRRGSIVIFFAFAFSIFLFICVVFVGLRDLFRYNVFRAEFKAITATLDSEKERNAVLNRQMGNVKNPSFWEYQAKTRLGYVHQNESVYKFLDATQDPAVIHP